MRNQSRLFRRQHRQNELGFTAYVIILLAATLAGISMLAIDFGRGSNRISMEKQLLDSHAYIVGQQVISQGINAACVNGEFVSSTDQLSQVLFNQLDEVERDDRKYYCQELDDGEVLIREEGDPSGPPGTFRRYRVCSDYNALQDPNSAQNEGEDVKRCSIVEVREIGGKVEKPRPQIMFVLDYSGSMSSNGRGDSLKSAMQDFVNAAYEVDYGVVLFDSSVRTTIGLGDGANHNSSVMTTVNSNSPGGGTAFEGPMRDAVNALNQRNNQSSYVVLVSDGVPHDGDSAKSYVNNVIRAIDPTICESRQGNQICHTVYTLGVDNADINMLESLSGNAATDPAKRDDYVFQISAQDTQAAFLDILDDIMCSFGPINPLPSEDELQSLTVLLNEVPLEYDEDYKYDNGLIKLYDANGNQACTRALENDGSITIRYGKPRVIAE